VDGEAGATARRLGDRIDREQPRDRTPVIVDDRA
jgi:hypothetical protein